jgi:hypothetical protein
MVCESFTKIGHGGHASLVWGVKETAQRANALRVMAGLVPAIHEFMCDARKSCMPGT